jgi:hypothetical protein
MIEDTLCPVPGSNAPHSVNKAVGQHVVSATMLSSV